MSDMKTLSSSFGDKDLCQTTSECKGELYSPDDAGDLYTACDVDGFVDHEDVSEVDVFLDNEDVTVTFATVVVDTTGATYVFTAVVEKDSTAVVGKDTTDVVDKDATAFVEEDTTDVVDEDATVVVEEATTDVVDEDATAFVEEALFDLILFILLSLS